MFVTSTSLDVRVSGFRNLGDSVLLVESKIRENFARGIRDQGFGIQNRAQVLRNPTKEWNPESKFH